MKILVTGAAGFIGYHLCKRLLQDSHVVVGFDNFNEYYDPKLKKARVENLLRFSKDNSFRMNDRNIAEICCFGDGYNAVINLAAYAGVRYSVEHSSEYIESNIVGFFNILKFVKDREIPIFVYASTSSVYGSNPLPWSEAMIPKNPPSLYAATKVCNEVL